MFVASAFQLPKQRCLHCRHHGLTMAEEPESGPSSRRRLLLGTPFALAAARFATVDSLPLSWEGPIRSFDTFVDMTGKTVLITGATTGIGYETAARLAEEGQHGQSDPLASPARLLRLPRARLAALCSSALPGRGRPAGFPTTASGARASRLQSRPCPRL